MTTITQSIPSLGSPPLTSDPVNFDTRADTLYGTSLPAVITATNTWSGQANTVAGEVNTNATNAQTAANTATGASAAAVAAVNATQWVSGQAYVTGAVVWSPINYLSYRANTNTSGTTDPSLSGSWVSLNVPIPVSVANGGTGLSTLGTAGQALVVNSGATGLEYATIDTNATLGTLTKTFTANELSTISLTKTVLTPVVSVTKEVPQTGVTNNEWDVSSTTENYERLNSATATTLTPSAVGNGTFTLGTGSFSAADVGKTIVGNGGVAVLTATNGSYVTSTNFTNTSAIASGDWDMYGVVYNAADGDLELSSVTDPATYFDVSTALFVDSFSVASQDIFPLGIAFSTNGTKMFIVGGNGSDVNEYDLSIGFDVSTATFVDAFSVAAQETSPSGIAFNADGTKMFIVGFVGDDVNEYTLSTGFDVSTATFVDSFSISAQETVPRGIAFNTDGTKMFIVGADGDDVNEYTLSTGFDVSTATFVDSFSVSAQDTIPVGIAFNTDGTKMFVVGQTGDDVNEYTLSTGFDVSTASFVDSFSVSAQETSPTGIAFNNNGTKMFIVGTDGDDVNEYNLGAPLVPSGYQPVHTKASIDTTYWVDINSMTANESAGDGEIYYALSTDDRTTYTVVSETLGARDIVRNNAGTWQYNSNGTYASETWTNATTNAELPALAQAMEGAEGGLINGFDVSTASFVDSFSVSAQETSPQGIAFNTDGTKMFIVGITGDDVNEYTLSTGFDVSTASFVDSFSVSAQEVTPTAIAFNTDGTKIFIVGYTGDDVNEYALSTGFDVSTASFVDSFSVADQETSPQGIAFNADGTKMFIVGLTGDNVNEYTLSTGFDVSTASFVDSFSVSAQDTTPRGIAFSTDGTKMFIVGETGKDVNEYTLSTGFDVSTASFVDSFSVASQDTNPQGIAFNTDGTKMFIVGTTGQDVNEYNVGTPYYTNQMDKTQLDAVTDPNHIALGDDLDLAIIFNMTSGTRVPSSNGVSINYDANVLNEGAILGTDYDFDAPAGDKARITALIAGNYKVRVV
jgi:DNA-binding beta-propeller fold protein YncE